MEDAASVSRDEAPTRSGWLAAVVVGIAWVLTVASAVGRVALAVPVDAHRGVGGADGPLDPAVLAVALFAVGLVTVGGVIVLRRRSARRYGGLVVAAGASVALLGFANQYSQYALLVAPEAGLPFGMAAAWVHDLWMVGFAFQFFLLPVLFPDGGLPSRRWRPAFWATLAGVTGFTVVWAFTVRPVGNAFEGLSAAPANPLGVLPPLPEVAFNVAFAVLIPLMVVVGVGGLITRWRGATGVVRQQIKWVLYAFGLVLTAGALFWIDLLLVEVVGLDLGIQTPVNWIGSLSLVAVVVALGVAMLRYRLYEIDRIISRTASYGLVVAILGAVYVVGVLGLGTAVTSLTGEEASDLVVAVSVLAVVALFRPLRARVQAGVDRRFNRSGFEARRAVETFAENLRDEVDLETIRRQVARTAAVAVQPTHVSIWAADLEERISSVATPASDQR